MHHAAACSVQDQPALHKLRLVVWPDMDLRHLEALRKAAPQLQIVTVHMDVSSTHLHSVSALSGIVLVTAPASEPWVISWRQWKARSCLLSNYLPAACLIDQRHVLQEA